MPLLSVLLLCCAVDGPAAYALFCETDGDGLLLKGSTQLLFVLGPGCFKFVQKGVGLLFSAWHRLAAADAHRLLLLSVCGDSNCLRLPLLQGSAGLGHELKQCSAHRKSLLTACVRTSGLGVCALSGSAAPPVPTAATHILQRQFQCSICCKLQMVRLLHMSCCLSGCRVALPAALCRGGVQAPRLVTVALFGPGILSVCCVLVRQGQHVWVDSIGAWYDFGPWGVCVYDTAPCCMHGCTYVRAAFPAAACLANCRMN
ncbi:hypothetical protein COO60DRAFT_101385 [Scenedesmus sp. NREL 46B-D3]|nr:hypothetical protein COO60DRAFT_101385 [Scenedesmus sp. NREL 46B-D3]